jgi:hypothetical protein
MPFEIVPATKKSRLARIAFQGPSGSGKSRSAFNLAEALCEKVGVEKFVVIDTEADSAHDYAHLYSYDVCPFEKPYSPDRYIEALSFCEQAGYQVIVIDGISQEWNGPGGCLALVDKAAAQVRGNSYVAWRGVTPKHNNFIQAMLWSPAHIIVTMRSKQEYAQEKHDGKTRIVKLGLGPIQREGTDYEFQIVVDMTLEGHIGRVIKGRADELMDKEWTKPGAAFSAAYINWLTEGEADLPRLRKRVKESWIMIAFENGLLEEPKISSTEEATMLKTRLGTLYTELDDAPENRLKTLREEGKQAILFPAPTIEKSKSPEPEEEPEDPNPSEETPSGPEPELEGKLSLPPPAPPKALSDEDAQQLGLNL